MPLIRYHIIGTCNSLRSVCSSRVLSTIYLMVDLHPSIASGSHGSPCATTNGSKPFQLVFQLAEYTMVSAETYPSMGSRYSIQTTSQARACAWPTPRPRGFSIRRGSKFSYRWQTAVFAHLYTSHQIRPTPEMCISPQNVGCISGLGSLGNFPNALVGWISWVVARAQALPSLSLSKAYNNLTLTLF